METDLGTNCSPVESLVIIKREKRNGKYKENAKKGKPSQILYSKYAYGLFSVLMYTVKVHINIYTINSYNT